MFNLLKTDFYKSVRVNYIWTILLVMVVHFAFGFEASCRDAVIEFHYPWYYNKDNFSFYKSFISEMSNLLLYIGLCTAIFASSDLRNRTIKNIIPKYPREYIYISKFIVLTCYIILIMILIFITKLIVAKVVVGNEIPNYFEYNNDFIEDICKVFLQNVAFMSLILCLTMQVKTLVVAMFNTCIILIIQVVWAFIDGALFHDKKTGFQIYRSVLAITQDPNLLRGLIVIFTYIIVTTTIGIYVFRKRDIT